MILLADRAGCVSLLLLPPRIRPSQPLLHSNATVDQDTPARLVFNAHQDILDRIVNRVRSSVLRGVKVVGGVMMGWKGRVVV